MTDSEKLDLILSKLETLEQRTTNIESKVSNIEDKVNDINLTIENEIRVNIQRVAEGHLDLSRNLHEALRIDNEKKCFQFVSVFLKLS